jgi:hypothetical protein
MMDNETTPLASSRKCPRGKEVDPIEYFNKFGQHILDTQINSDIIVYKLVTGGWIAEIK